MEANERIVQVKDIELGTQFRDGLGNTLTLIEADPSYELGQRRLVWKLEGGDYTFVEYRPQQQTMFILKG